MPDDVLPADSDRRRRPLGKRMGPRPPEMFAPSHASESWMSRRRDVRLDLLRDMFRRPPPPGDMPLPMPKADGGSSGVFDRLHRRGGPPGGGGVSGMSPGGSAPSGHAVRKAFLSPRSRQKRLSGPPFWASRPSRSCRPRGGSLEKGPGPLASDQPKPGGHGRFLCLWSTPCNWSGVPDPHPPRDASPKCRLRHRPHTGPDSRTSGNLWNSSELPSGLS